MKRCYFKSLGLWSFVLAATEKNNIERKLSKFKKKCLLLQPIESKMWLSEEFKLNIHVRRCDTWRRESEKQGLRIIICVEIDLGRFAVLFSGEERFERV
jgi:hypothetical protein